MVLADPLLPDSSTIILLWLSWDNLAANLSLRQLLSSHALQPAPGVGALCDQDWEACGVCCSTDRDTMWESLGCSGQELTGEGRNTSLWTSCLGDRVLQVLCLWLCLQGSWGETFVLHPQQALGGSWKGIEPLPP